MGHEMKKKTKVIDFPKIAEPNIDTVFAEFLKDQQDRLKLKSYQRYEEVIDLFRHCLNGSGYHELDDSSEVILYERLYFQKNHEFCVIFGPDKIVPALSGFMNYFMTRKVMASESLLQATGTVAKRLIKWLEEHRHIDREQAVRGYGIASEAARELPAAERLARLLYDYAHKHAPRYWTAELDDYFTVEKVQPGILLLSGISNSELVEVRAPKEITDHCKVGWQINLLLGKTRNGWCILESGNVYPN